MKKTMRKWLALGLAAIMAAALFSACGDKGASSSVPEMSVRESASSQAAASNMQNYQSSQNALTFDYPADWTVSEDGNVITITAPAGQNATALIADITYETTLFLGGQNTIEEAATALMLKYGDLLAGGSEKSQYDESASADGDRVTAKVSFAFSSDGKDMQGYVDIFQVGGRVMLSAFVSPLGADDLFASREAIAESCQLENTDAPLEPADLYDELGLPYPPEGFYGYYNPVTGQFFFFPDDWQLTSNDSNAFVTLVNDEGAVMIMENWTDTFYSYYNSNGQDVEECFDYFLNECAALLESEFGDITYSGFQYMATEGEELIKAPFNYTLANGATGRCFAELSVRPHGGTDYVQATMALYKPGDQYSIDMFSIIMDSTVILYPDL